jgi:hypothetical protein
MMTYEPLTCCQHSTGEGNIGQILVARRFDPAGDVRPTLVVRARYRGLALCTAWPLTANADTPVSIMARACWGDPCKARVLVIGNSAPARC